MFKCSRWLQAHICENPKKVVVLFSKIKRPMSLNLGIQHWVCERFHVSSDDVPVLTFTYYMKFQIWILMNLHRKF